MMNFFKSEDIRIFPCTYRGLNTTASALISEDNQKYIKSLNIDPESHMLSEYNLTTLANYPAGKNSYIINKDDTTLDCVIKGYHIRIANLNNYYTWSGSLYLAIKTKAYPLTEAVDGKDAYDIEYLFPFGLTGELAKAAEAATTPLSLDYCDENNDDENNYSYCYAVGYADTDAEADAEAGANDCYYLQITDDEGAIVAKNLVTNIVEFYKDNNTNILNGNTKINGDTQIAGDITIEKKATVKGTATVKGNFTATGSLTAKGALAVIGETALQNKLTVKPSAEGTTVLTVQPDKVEITGELATTKSTIGAGGLVATGTIQAKGGLTVANGKATSLGGTLNVTGEITANNGIKVNQGTTSLQATDINGKLEVTGDISAATISINSNALEVNSAGKTTVKEVTINKGTANLSQVTIEAADTDVTALEVKKGIAKFKAFSADSGDIGGSLSVTGTITGGIINGTTVTSQGADFEDAEITSLTIKDGATISYDDTKKSTIVSDSTNTLTVTCPVTIENTLTATGKLTVSKDGLDVTGGAIVDSLAVGFTALQVDDEGKTTINDLTAATATIVNDFSAASGTIGGNLNVTDTITGATIKTGDKVNDTIINSTTVKSQEADFEAAKITTAEVTSLTVKDGATISYDAANKATTVSGSLILSADKMLKVDTIQPSTPNGNVFVNSTFKAGTTTLKNLYIRNFNSKTNPQSETDASLTVKCRDDKKNPGSVKIQEPLTVTAAATFNNPVTFNNQVTATSLTATNLTVTGKLNCNPPSGEDQHTISGNTNINGDIINITGDTTVSGTLTSDGSLKVTGGARVDHLVVGSTAPAADTGEITAQKLNVCSGGLQVNDAGKTTINDLTATTANITNATINGGTANLSQVTVESLTIKNGATISYDAKNNYTTVSVPQQQQLFIQGKTNINHTLSAGTTTLKALTVKEDASITGALTVNGDVNIAGNFSLKSTASKQVIFDLANPVGTVFTAIGEQVPENYFRELLGITSYWKYLGKESAGETTICFWQRVKTEGEKVDPPAEDTPEEPTQE